MCSCRETSRSSDGKIAAVGVEGGGSGIAIPGLVDLQVNGFGGVDFASADAAGYRRAGEALLEGGVTAFQPTLTTAPEEALTAALAAIPEVPIGPRVIGAHLEGPFLSPVRLGAHPVSARRDPDSELLERLLAAGPVTEMTLAPELPGALELIDLLVARGVVVSCGHSDATAEEALRAFDRGAATVTHLFNAMRPLRHRDPGIAGAALARDDVVVQVILDGHHLAEETAQVIWRAAAGRVALVSDAIAAAGVGDGTFRLGGTDVEVLNGVARREDGVLAGSSSTLIDGVRRTARARSAARGRRQCGYRRPGVGRSTPESRNAPPGGRRRRCRARRHARHQARARRWRGPRRRMRSQRG